MCYELLLLLLGAAAIAIVFRATDPFRISAMQRAMRCADTLALLHVFDAPQRRRNKKMPLPWPSRRGSRSSR